MLGDIAHITGNTIISEDGSIIIGNRVTISESIYAFAKNNNSWDLDQVISVDNNLYNPSIDISKDNSTLAVGNKYTEKVYIYSNENNSWEQVGNISQYGSGIGKSISLSGDGEVVAIGLREEMVWYRFTLKIILVT